MTSSRKASLGATPEQQQLRERAEELSAQFSESGFHLRKRQEEFTSWKPDGEDGFDPDELTMKDPQILATNLSEQITYFRKLKFQYLEQNAKDRYVKSIVSDIDDAPIVTADDNQELAALNAEKKERLKAVKAKLAEKQQDVRTLAPMVEADFQKAEAATKRAATLAQQILDARLVLSRLRQTHPHPRLTIATADQKLAEQIEEMQTLNDEVQATSEQSRDVKRDLKRSALDLENLRMERAEVEKAVKRAHVDENDQRLVPLYNWFTTSIKLQHSIQDIQELHAASENELRLTYSIDAGQSSPHLITIVLIFAPDTRQLAAVQTQGVEELGIEMGDAIDAHVQVNDVHGLIAAILSRVRTGIEDSRRDR